jgi:hypothetical protein
LDGVGRGCWNFHAPIYALFSNKWSMMGLFFLFFFEQGLVWAFVPVGAV